MGVTWSTNLLFQFVETVADHPICFLDVPKLINHHIEETRIRIPILDERRHVRHRQRRHSGDPNLLSGRRRHLNFSPVHVVVDVVDGARLGKIQRRLQPELLRDVQNPRHKPVVGDGVDATAGGGQAPDQIPESPGPGLLEELVIGLDGVGGEEAAVVVAVGDGLDGERRRVGGGGGVVVEEEFGEDEGDGGALVVEAFGEL